MATKTECSACFVDVTVDADEGTATATVPSNGKRGAGHVPAHVVTTQGYVDDVMTYWECPVCGYADSTEHEEEG